MAPRTSVPTVDSQRPRGALTFLQPAPQLEPTTDPTSDPSLPASLPSLDPSEGSPSPSDEPSDELRAESAGAPTSSRGSSGSALSKRALRDAARRAVLMAGSVAHAVLARDAAQQQVGLYLADEDDAENIGDPLASIAQRRGGIGAAGNPDVGDAIAALIGLAMYGAKQFARFAEARAYTASAAPATEVGDELEQDPA